MPWYVLWRAHFFCIEWTKWGVEPPCWNHLTNGKCNWRTYEVTLFLWDFFSLLHLKTGSLPSPLFVFVSQECESRIKGLINLEARRQSRPCSRSSAWDREEKRESERQREGKLNRKWSELEWKTQGGFRMKDNLSRLSLLDLYFFPPMLYLPWRKSSIPSTLICCDGWFEFLVVIFLCPTVFRKLSSD